MSNDFYNASGTPAQGSQLVTPNMRAEFAAIAAGFNKFPALTGNAYKITYINAGGAAIDVVGGDGLLKLSTAGVPSIAVDGVDYVSSIPAVIVAATAKTTPVDADLLGIVDSADSNTLKKLTWANLKATIFAAFPTAVAAAASKATPVDADMLPIYDSAAPTTQTKLSWANLKATLVATINTWSAKQIYTGSIKLQQAIEKIVISATAATGTVNYDMLTQAVLYYTSNAAANWTLNVRGDGGNSLDSIMSTGETMTLAFLVTQGSTAYYQSALTIDGNSVTPKWSGGTAPSSGNASSVDAYTYAIIKTGSAAFTVLATQTRFA